MSSLLSSEWGSLLSALPPSIDLTALARSEGAIKRSRRISDGETLLRLALWYGPCGLSLRSAAALAAGTDTAHLSDVALLKRLSGAADWLEAIVAAILAERPKVSAPLGEFVAETRDLVLLDGTAISQPGSRGSDWVLHSRYKPGHGFSGFELTDRHGAETLERHTFNPGEIVIADRVYARGKGFSHVLSRDSQAVQRNRHALFIEGVDGVMDGSIERVGIDEGLVGEMMGLEIAPDGFDVVQLRGVFGQPLDGEPVGAGGQGCLRDLAGVDWPVVLDQHHGLGGLTGLGAVDPIELFKVGDKVAAAFGLGGMHDEFAGRVIERAQNRDFFCLARCRNAQIRARLCPCTSEVRVSQRLALVAVEQNDVADCGLLLEKLEAQADPLDFASHLTTLQRVPGPPPAELFFRRALESCARLMLTPSRASISAHRRGMVQLGRSATGALNNGMTTRSAASLFTGAGPGATVAFSASTPPFIKSLRQSRTVSSRTPKASAIRPLVQPDIVSTIARARSASPRSREPANSANSACCSLLAQRGDFPLMNARPRFVAEIESDQRPLVKLPISA